MRPDAAALNLTISFPLSPTFVTTTLTPLVPWTQLLANIVGLSGVLSVVGVLFGCAERRFVGKKGGAGVGGGAGEGDLPVGARMSRLSALVEEARQNLAEVAAMERSLAQAVDDARGGSRSVGTPPLERALVVQRNPLHAAARPVEVWMRHTDETGDVWYIGPSGQTEWDAPSGAQVVDAAEGGAGE